MAMSDKRPFHGYTVSVLLAHAPPSGGAWAPCAPSLEPRSGQMIEGLFPAPPAGRFTGALFAPAPPAPSKFDLETRSGFERTQVLQGGGKKKFASSPHRSCNRSVCVGEGEGEGVCVHRAVRMARTSGGKLCVVCGKNEKKLKVDGR